MKFLQLKALNLLPLVLISLVLGISGGLIRLGEVSIPIAEAGIYYARWLFGDFDFDRARDGHGKKTWLIIPLLTGSSVFLFLMGYADLELILLMAGSLSLSLIMHLQSLKHPKFHTALLYGGVVSWFVGISSLGKQLPPIDSIYPDGLDHPVEN
ncbi:hypothetical protein [Lunatimonas salinarum]|uniref:hypothetical protein n=1 Tax=Lunatimonas salinarum TaxID=1774590 RepID=UPI001ADFAB77|nr:hypothetical protein [Lunatimonas salinarum]